MAAFSLRLVAHIGRVKDLKEIGIHSKKTSYFVFPDTCLHDQGMDPEVGRVCTGGVRMQ